MIVPRFPDRSKPVWSTTVFCGVDPEGALLRALDELAEMEDDEFWFLWTQHDDGCPAMTTGPMKACTCEIVYVDAQKAA